MTDFRNDQATGSVLADSVTAAALIGPVTGALTGPITASGAFKSASNTIAAIGAAQGSATTIPTTALVVIITATASAQGVKMTAGASNTLLILMTTGTKAPHLYPGANGQLGTTATNGSVQLTANALAIYYTKNGRQWFL